MDDVFVACDRTESTLGQHALYHRLRSAPAGRHLAAFEALVTRMTDDAAARERAQLALARLRDPHGYDLWWLGQREVLEPRAWHLVFPVLALTVLGLDRGAAVLARAAAVPHRGDRRRDRAALLDGPSCARRRRGVSATRADHRDRPGAGLSSRARRSTRSSPRSGRTPPSLGRLKTIARWVSGDPFMFSVSPSGGAIAPNDFVGVIYDYLNFVFFLDANGVYFGAAELRKRGGPRCFGSWRRPVTWTRPSASRRTAPASSTGRARPFSRPARRRR